MGEIKKQRYVYYRCTGYRGKCGELYVRQEVLERKFSEVLRRLAFDDEVLAWVREALSQSHADEKRDQERAVAKLMAEHGRLQRRIHAMYVDKLDGRIDAEFFDRMSARWRAEQDRCLREIERHTERTSPTSKKACVFSNSPRTPKGCLTSRNRGRSVVS